MIRDDEDLLGDSALLRAARSGSGQAFGQLWDRHQQQAVRFAARLVGPSEAEDLVSEAFTSIYQAIQNGAGPDELFRPYLYTTLKNLSIRWSIRESTYTLEEIDFDQMADGAVEDDGGIAALERSYEALAFRSLPQRWQEVLWYGEVEGLKPRDIAPILGMSANAVAALSYRARDGFRKAWLELRAQDGFTADRPREKELVARLRVVLIPLLLGIPTAEVFRSGLAAEPIVAAAASPAGASVLGGSTASGLLAGAAAVGIAGVLVASSVVVDDGGLATPANVIVATDESAVPAYGRPHDRGTVPIATELFDPSRVVIPGVPVASQPVPVPGTSEPAPDPAPPALLPPATTPVINTPAPGQRVGGGPFTIEGAGTGDSEILISIDGTAVATTIAASDSSWSYIVDTPLSEGPHELQVAQRSENRSLSSTSRVPFVVDKTAPAAPALTMTLDRYSTSAPSLSGTAEPWARVIVSVPGAADVVAVADGTGAWSTQPLPGVTASTTSISIVQVDTAGNASEPLSVPVEFAPRFWSGHQPSYSQTGWGMFVIYAYGWPGASYRVYFDGMPVYSGGYISTFGSGLTPVYPGGPSVSVGTHTISVAYVDPETLEPLSIENFTLVVTP